MNVFVHSIGLNVVLDVLSGYCFLLFYSGVAMDEMHSKIAFKSKSRDETTQPSKVMRDRL